MYVQHSFADLPPDADATPTDKVEVAFKDVDIAIFVGSMAKTEGMQKKDLLKANVELFRTRGAALDKYAKKTVMVLVVGHLANTNCLIACKSAPTIPKKNFSCLTRLDHNRACYQVALRCGVSADCVKNVIIWGNHSASQYPDVHHAKVNMHGTELAAYDCIKDDAWLHRDFISTVRHRFNLHAAGIEAGNRFSCMSTAKAICDHLKDIWFGTKEGDFISMGVYAGENSYNIPEDLVFSFPVQVKQNKTCKVVTGLFINDFSRGKIDVTAAELMEEREAALQFMPNDYRPLLVNNNKNST